MKAYYISQRQAFKRLKGQRDLAIGVGVAAVLATAFALEWRAWDSEQEWRGSYAFLEQQNAQLQYQLDELDAGLSRAQAAERKALWMVGQFSEAVRNTHKLAPGDAFEQIDALTGQAADMVRNASARLVKASYQQHEIDMGE